MNYTIDLKKLQKQIANIESISRTNKWKYKYDEDLDSLYYSPNTIKKGFSLLSVNDEFSVFINKKSEIGGIFVEYFNSNLSSHTYKFKQFKLVFTNHMKKLPKKKLEEKEEILTGVLKGELLSRLVQSDNPTLIMPA